MQAKEVTTMTVLFPAPSLFPILINNLLSLPTPRKSVDKNMIYIMQRLPGCQSDIKDISKYIIKKCLDLAEEKGYIVYDRTFKCRKYYKLTHNGLEYLKENAE
jgi:hypothetical protein